MYNIDFKKPQHVHFIGIGGISMSGLAEILHLSQDTVSLWELDKSLPDINSLIILSKTFGVTTDYILGLEK